MDAHELREIPRSPRQEFPQEDADMERRRLKGKSIATGTPTSKEKNHPGEYYADILAPLTIKEPTTTLPAPSVRPPPPTPLVAPRLVKGTEIMDMDLEMEKIDRVELDAMVITDADMVNLEKSVNEFENLEMDDELIDNDDRLGDSPDVNAEQIEALTQLSPAHAEWNDGQLGEEDRESAKKRSATQGISPHAKDQQMTAPTPSTSINHKAV